jgi:hypothetical protein
VSVRRGVRVAGLLAGRSAIAGTPHATGVHTAVGEQIHAEALREPGCFTRVVQACPMQAHWLDGTPITDVLPMAGILDRYRRFVVDGRPVITGFAAVGNAWVCTNPSAGRGLSVGLIHVQLLRKVVGGYLEDPTALARVWDEHTEQFVAPNYWNQIAADHARIAEMNALRNGLEPPPPDSMMDRFGTAAGYDADVSGGWSRPCCVWRCPRECSNGLASKTRSVSWVRALRCGSRGRTETSYSNCSQRETHQLVSGVLTRRRSPYR